MMRFDPVTLEDFTELFGPGGRMVLMAGAIACTALAGPALADMPRAPATAGATAAQSPSAPAAPVLEGDAGVAPSTAERPSAPAAHVRRPTPMMLEMQQVLTDERKALTELRTRFAAARGPAALEIQREIERLKASTEVSLLRVQATWARRQGRLDVARELDAAIEQALHPVAPAAAVAPARDGVR